MSLNLCLIINLILLYSLFILHTVVKQLLIGLGRWYIIEFTMELFPPLYLIDNIYLALWVSVYIKIYPTWILISVG